MGPNPKKQGQQAINEFLPDMNLHAEEILKYLDTTKSITEKIFNTVN